VLVGSIYFVSRTEKREGKRKEKRVCGETMKE
jgi:hypothetical protein